MNPIEEREMRMEILQNTASLAVNSIQDRIKTLTFISGQSAALLGIAAALDKNSSIYFVAAAILSTIVAITSLGRYIYITRNDIKKLIEKMKKVADLDLTKPLPKKEIKNDYWVEVLFTLFISSLLMLLSSILINGKIQATTIQKEANTIQDTSATQEKVEVKPAQKEKTQTAPKKNALISEKKVNPGETFIVDDYGDLGKYSSGALVCTYKITTSLAPRNIQRIYYYSPGNMLGRSRCPDELEE